MKGLFNDFNVDNSQLGADVKTRNKLIAKVLIKVRDMNLGSEFGDNKIDAFGDAYEFLMTMYASNAGKSGGEFFTPQEVSELLARLTAADGHEIRSVYDPACGSGSLLLKFSKTIGRENPALKYYGQELMPSTYNLARMNMFLHGVLPENQHLRNGDTLDADWPTDEETEFDVVTMNPPYSAKWSAAAGFKQDERFLDYGGNLAPKSKADYAFLLHGFYHLKQTGTMAIVLPHGVLFRGGSERAIRKTLLQNGSIYAVIGLPSNMFYNTSIPTCIIVLKKHRDGRDVLFIDASNFCEKQKKQNVMIEEHINKVVELYKDRKSVDKTAYLASYEDIEANDFNLNIPRYVDTSEEEPEIDMSALASKIKTTNKDIQKCNDDLLAMLSDLTFNKPETKAAVDDFISVFKEA